LQKRRLSQNLFENRPQIKSAATSGLMKMEIYINVIQG